MHDVFSKCGARCGRCPAYRENVRTDEDRQRCSDGWHRYLGFRLKPERCYCDGCQTPDDQNPTLVLGRAGCQIRRCAVQNGFLTCAHCSAYPCDAVAAQFDLEPDSREEIADRLGRPVPEADYLLFIEPYESHRHLDEIRASLPPGDILQPVKPPPYQARTSAFPEQLPLPEEQVEALRAIHRLIRRINVVDADTHALLERGRNRRQYLLKLLWALGLVGEWTDEDGPHLVLDVDAYSDQKLASHFKTVQGHLESLQSSGLQSRFVPLGEGWILPSGWLRQRSKSWDKGWLLKIRFEDRAGGTAALRVLQTYAQTLDTAYGKRAYTYFARADMRVLCAT